MCQTNYIQEKGFFIQFLFQVILGKVLKFPSNLDEKLQKQVMDCSDGLLTAVGDTMCAHDFYEGMSRVWTKQVGYERYLQTPLSLWR